MLEFDELDKKLMRFFPGFITQKSLTYQFKNTYQIPMYVLEYLLGMYCTSPNPEELEEGINKVKSVLATNFVKHNEIDLIKSRIKEQGSYVIIDKIKATYNEKTDIYEASFSNFDVVNFYLASDYVTKYEKLLTDGIWAIIKLKFQSGGIREGKNVNLGMRRGKYIETIDSPFMIENIQPIQMPSIDFDDIIEYRKEFSLQEWIDVIIRSIGYEPNHLDHQSKLHLIERIVPLVEKNYNLCELGPRSTGKSFIYKEISPYSILISGGQSSVASLFYNISRKELGLVGQWDCVAFDEVAGIEYKDFSVIQMMKDYMTLGTFTRGTHVLSGEASLVFVGNINDSPEHLMKVSHLFSPFPEGINRDSAFFDRMHYYIPGWEVPKLKAKHFTTHFGFISDYISEFFKQSRSTSRVSSLLKHFTLNAQVNKRDEIAIHKTLSGLLKVLFPDESETEADVEYLLRYAIQGRRRVKEQLNKIIGQEFAEINLGFIRKRDNEEFIVYTNEQVLLTLVSLDTLEPGHVYGVGADIVGDIIGIFKIENKKIPGDGKFRFERVYTKYGKEMLIAAYEMMKDLAKNFVPADALNSSDFLISFLDTQGSGESNHVSLAALIGLFSALMDRPVLPGLVICGNFTLTGSMEELPPLEDIMRVTKNSGANKILLPEMSLVDYERLPDYYKEGIRILTYHQPIDAIKLALGV